ncbi:MAG: TadE/TadG family type IV pilus assembly protein [Bacilli bacterium]
MKKKNLLNNKGQALVMFLLFLPVLLIALGFVVDISMMGYNSHKLDSINKLVLNEMKDSEEIDKAKELIKKNDTDIIIVEFKDEDNYIYLKLKKKINSVFGNIIGINSYDIVSNYKLNKEEKKIIKIEE